jgi:murein endopeptidase
MRAWIGTLLAVVAATALCGEDERPRAHVPPVATPTVSPGMLSTERPAQRPERIRWRASVAVGSHAAGRLVRGVQLPAERPGFFTWDPVRRRSPNRHWRRWGTDTLVRTLLDVVREYRAAHPRAPRMAIGDLSRPRGGDFGPQFGFIGHQTHQNGLDADVYYPRTDRRLSPPKSAELINRALAQELVDRFIAAGAEAVLVGPATGLKGPPGQVKVVPNHDNHLHVRMPNPRLTVR